MSVLSCLGRLLVHITSLQGSFGWCRRLGGGGRRPQFPDIGYPAVPYKANAAGRHHVPQECQRVTNWSVYDAALCRPGSQTVWFTEEAIASWVAAPDLDLKATPRQEAPRQTG
jgi:hypothetical protein